MLRVLRIMLTVVLWGALALAGGAASVTAQNGDEDGFPLPTNTAFCEPGYMGPFVDCTPWEGVTVTYTSADGTFTQSCTTVATWERTAGCTINVPFGSTITASIDPAVVPTGYVLEQSPSQTFEIPDGPPQGEFGGPVFVLFAAETPTEVPTETPTEVPEPTAVPTETPEPEPTTPVDTLPGTGTGEASGTGYGEAGLIALVAAGLAAILGAGVIRRSAR